MAQTEDKTPTAEPIVEEATKTPTEARPTERLTRGEKILVTLGSAGIVGMMTGFFMMYTSMLELQRQVGDVRTEIAGLRAEMHQEIGVLRVEMHREIGGLRVEIDALAERIARLEGIVETQFGIVSGSADAANGPGSDGSAAPASRDR